MSLALAFLSLVETDETRRQAKSLLSVKTANAGPLKVKVKSLANLALGAILFSCGCCSLLGYLTFFAEPASKEGRFAKGATEVPVSLANLGLKGGVLSQRGNELSLSTDAGPRLIYRADPQWRLMRLAGPNKSDQIALVTIGPNMDVYKLLLLDLQNGSRIESRTLTGNVIWKKAVGDCALHPTELRLAHFRGDGRSHQFSSPQAYVGLGTIIEHDFKTGKERTLAADVIEQPLDYSPDGKHLFCTKKTPLAQLQSKDKWPAPELAQFTDKNQPGVIRVDLRTKVETVLGYGWSSTVTSDGRDLVVSGFSGPIGVHDLVKGSWTPVKKEGMLDYVYPFEFLTRDLVLGSALPLKEQDVKFFPWTGSVSGRHQRMRLGVFNLKTKQAAVLRDDLDRYDVVGWRPASEPVTAQARDAP